MISNAYSPAELFELKIRLCVAEEHVAHEIVNAICDLVGVDPQMLRSRNRTADVAECRALIAWILCDCFEWSQNKTANALDRTPRQIKRLLRSQRQ